jgi:hypothetical protein
LSAVRTLDIGSLIRRIIPAVIGATGLIWALLALPASSMTDALQEIERHLLRFETYKQPDLDQILQDKGSLELSGCDTHSQRALLLIEMPELEAALQSGDSQVFDRHVQSLEDRSRLILSCTPRESFVWLLLFDLAVLHGQLDEQSYRLLAMSYQTSPNEAWISIRRTAAALPLALGLSAPLRKAVFFEFQQLIRYGFVEDAARSYARSSQAVRAALQSEIEQLEGGQQQAFWRALQAKHS